MPTWDSDGLLGGINRVDNSLEGGALEAAVAQPDAGHFATAGSVDAEVITRVQYDAPGFGFWVEDPLQVTGSFTFTSGDVSANPGKELTATAFLVPADFFEEGEVPTPQQIYNAAGVAPGAGTFRYGETFGGGTTTAGSVGFYIYLPYEYLLPNKKYWVLLAPTRVVTGSANNVVNDVPFTPVNTRGRAISFWTNRTPEAPTITSPLSGSIVPAGSKVTLAFKPNDPDALPSTVKPVTAIPRDVRSWVFSDLAGVQVQYAPRSTEDGSPPEWLDLPITTMDYPTVVGHGWYIENSNYTLIHDGAKLLRDTLQLPLYCGASDIEPGVGLLPEGNWQLRMRTFDYGHLNATVIIPGTGGDITTYGPGLGPLGLEGSQPTAPPGTVAGGVDYPEVNTSPWSEPVNIVVTTQVPAPLPVSPKGNIAIPDGDPVVLDWEYLNTAADPYAQLQRQVQIRKVGDLEWTTLVSGNSTATDYDLLAPEDNQPPVPGYPEPYEYLPNGEFDAGVDGWYTGSTNGVSVVTNSFDGGHALQLNQISDVFLTQNVIRQITLRPEDKYLSVRGWSYKNYGSVTEHYMLINFYPADLSSVLGSFRLFEPEEPEVTGYWEFDDLLIPTGAGKVLVAFVFFSADGSFGYIDTSGGGGPWVDHVSVKGSTVTPVKPPVLGEVVLPTQAPVPYALEPGTHYEWRVRVTDAAFVTSEWSAPSRFWYVAKPTSGPTLAYVSDRIDGATLGTGRHTAFIYRRGGRVEMGRLSALSYVEWNRQRDEMTDAKVVVSGWDEATGEMLADIHTWAHELVIYRNNGFSNDRVWEGPLSLPRYENDKVTLHAKDVMAYPYRRIVKQGMNDFGTSPTAGRSVVMRGAAVLQNVMAPDDPNVLPYLTLVVHDDDARQYRSLPPYSRTAYEELDDMAASAGMDYTAVGRRIILWGTKHRIGTLPEFRDEHLGSSPIVSEYGMSMANHYAVSDGNGVYGEATRLDENGEDPDYGLVELLSSSWASDSGNESGTYTEAGLATVRKSFEEYAERSIADRYPPPLVVRIPDNTTLNPNTPISIQHLVPGVVLPLRSTKTLRKAVGNQKLDSVKVVETEGKETVSITMSPFNRDDITSEATE